MYYLRLFFTLLILSTMSISSAWAEDTIELPLTKQSAADIIQAKSKGKILSVDKDKTSKNIIFLIKVLHKDGKVKIYKLDASTGLPPK